MRGNTALAYEYDVEPEPEMLDNVIPIGQRRTLLELTEQTCRWPIGDPGSADFFFCVVRQGRISCSLRQNVSTAMSHQPRHITQSISDAA